MRVNEIFYSLQGEGFLAGVPSVFIRLPGCPLRCRWCDTKYAWNDDAGIEKSIEDIVEEVDSWPCNNVVITGGEPMISSQLHQLVKALNDIDIHITIETSGIAYIPDMPCDLMSISPKLSNSVPLDEKMRAAHEDFRLDLAVLSELIENYDFQLKFVVENESDLPEIEETLERLCLVEYDKVMLMPQATTREEYIEKAQIVAELCKSTGFVFSQRLQVLLWNNQKGC